MDRSNNNERPAEVAGVIYKSAQLETQAVTPEDLRKINKYTLEPLGEADVFTFSPSGP